MRRVTSSTPSELLTIGAFARLVGLTPSALRFYDDCGLLPPAHVDPATGYRWYDAGQAPRAKRLRVLRDVDLPLQAARGVLDGTSDEAARVLTEHLESLQGKAERARRTVEEVLADLGDGSARVTLAGPELASAVRQVEPAAARDGADPVLTHVLLEVVGDEVRLVATDRYRLSRRVLHPVRAHGGDISLLVPAATLVELAAWAARHAEVELVAEDGAASLRAGDQIRPLPTGGGDFPSYADILDGLEPATTRVIADRVALLDLLRDNASPVLPIEIGADEIVVDGTRLPAVCAGEPMRIGFAPSLLAAALSASVGPDVLLELSDQTRPVVVRSADQGTFTTLAMPYRLDETQ